MKIGTKVTCVDDSFPAEFYKVAHDTPVKGKTYTIRHIYCGRTLNHKTIDACLLEELHNPPDLDRGLNTEIGFALHRFIEPEELDESEKRVKEEPVPARTGEMQVSNPTTPRVF